jgi:hypothetical protein
MIDCRAIRAYPEIKLLIVSQERCICRLIELWDQLRKIILIRLTTLPLSLNTRKDAVGIVKLSALKLDHPLWIRSRMEANYVAQAAIMRLIQALLPFRHLLVHLFKMLQSFIVHSTYR